MDAARCIMNIVLSMFIFVLLCALFWGWLKGLDEHAREMFEKSLKERNDGSYEKYMEAKNRSEDKE